MITHLLSIGMILVGAVAGNANAADAQKPEDTETIEYRLEWTVLPEGKVTKKYELSYQGKEIQARLKEFLGEISDSRRYLRSILPNQEEGDELIEERVSEFGRYRWLFKARDQDTQHIKSNLFLWLSAVNDPLSVYWKPRMVEGTSTPSRYHYAYRPLRIRNRLIVRVPWRFKGGIPDDEVQFNKNGVDAEFSVRPLYERMGEDDLITVLEIRSEVRARDHSLSEKDLKNFREGYQNWVMERVIPVLVPNVPQATGKISGTSSFRWAGTHTRLGYTSVAAASQNFGTFDGAFGFSFEKRWNPHLIWRPALWDLEYLSRTKPDYNQTLTSLGSELILRYPFFLSPRGGSKNFISLETFAKPWVGYGFFSGDVLNSASNGVVTAITLGGRVAIGAIYSLLLTGNYTYTGLGFRWTRLMTGRGWDSMITFGLEIY